MKLKHSTPGDSKWPFYPQTLEVTLLTFDLGSRFQHPKKGGDFHFFVFFSQKVGEMIQLDFYLSDQNIYWNYPPHRRMPVTTRIIPFLVGNPYKPLFVIVGRG